LWAEGRKQKAEGSRQKAEGRKQKQKAIDRKEKAVGRRHNYQKILSGDIPALPTDVRKWLCPSVRLAFYYWAAPWGLAPSLSRGRSGAA